MVAKGAAYAIADRLTVEQFMDRGAAFGLQRTLARGKKRKRGKSPETDESVWGTTATFLRDKVRILTVFLLTLLPNMRLLMPPGI